MSSLPSGGRVATVDAARREVACIALRRTRSFGAASLAELVSSAGARGIRMSERQARETVTRDSDAQFLDDE